MRRSILPALRELMALLLVVIILGFAFMAGQTIAKQPQFVACPHELKPEPKPRPIQRRGYTVATGSKAWASFETPAQAAAFRRSFAQTNSTFTTIQRP